MAIDLFRRLGGYRLTRGALLLGLTALAVALLFPSLAHAGGAIAPGAGTSGHEAKEAGRWALVISLAFLVVGIPLISVVIRWCWWHVQGKGEGSAQPELWWGRPLFVGQDNRVSTSKTTAVVWTYTLAGALLSFIVARWFGHPEGFEQLSKQGLSAQYAVLIGGPLGAAILAKGIVSAQVDSGSAAKPAAESTSTAQLVQNDNGETDLGDLQYLLFNAVALVFFYGELLRVPQAGMPAIPEVLLGLTSVAAVGFVGKKVLAGPPSISAVTPAAARPGDRVRIATAGIIKVEGDLPALTVLFGTSRVEEGGLEMTATTTAGVLIDAVVPKGVVGKVDIVVSLPTGKQAKWSGFEVLPGEDKGT